MNSLWANHVLKFQRKILEIEEYSGHLPHGFNKNQFSHSSQMAALQIEPQAANFHVAIYQ